MRKIPIDFESFVPESARIAFTAVVEDSFFELTEHEINQRLEILKNDDRNITFPNNPRLKSILSSEPCKSLTFNDEVDLFKDYYENVLTSNSSPDFDLIFATQHIYRNYFRGDLQNRRIGLYTIDAEDQHLYFDNHGNQCTNLGPRRSRTQDTLLTNMLTDSFKELSKYDIHPIYMATGSDLSDQSRDGFGNPIRNHELNLEKMLEMGRTAQASFGFHSFNHESWLKRGLETVHPLNWRSKLLYVVKCTLNPIFYFNYAVALIKFFREVKNHQNDDARNELTETYVYEDFARLKSLFPQDFQFLKLSRAPGFRVSNGYFSAISKMQLSDSSLVIDWSKFTLPPIDYSMIHLGGESNFDLIRQYPCLFIDDLMRQKRGFSHRKFIQYIDNIVKANQLTLTICSHTKLLGTDKSHAHIMSHDARKGLGLPRNIRSTNLVLNKLAESIDFSADSLASKRLI